MTGTEPATRPPVETAEGPAFAALCDALAQRAAEVDREGAWPGEGLALCAAHGVFRWFVARERGGLERSAPALIRGYERLAGACMTTAFVITQFAGACRFLAASENAELRARLLPAALAGERFATIGISQLTTSRQHIGRPALRARETADGLVLDGFSPWVTGAPRAGIAIVGAALPDGRQVLVAVPTDAAGVTMESPVVLTALTGSHTVMVRLRDVTLERGWIVAGPRPEVLRNRPRGAGTGGLQTSALALGSATAAVEFLQRQAGERGRAELVEIAERFAGERDALRRDLLEWAAGSEAAGPGAAALRTRANSLARRATQASLVVAKGSGYALGHPASRWCREALFFAVWSSPREVADAGLRELARLPSPG